MRMRGGTTSIKLSRWRKRTAALAVPLERRTKHQTPGAPSGCIRKNHENLLNVSWNVANVAAWCLLTQWMTMVDISWTAQEGAVNTTLLSRGHKGSAITSGAKSHLKKLWKLGFVDIFSRLGRLQQNLKAVSKMYRNQKGWDSSHKANGRNSIQEGPCLYTSEFLVRFSQLSGNTLRKSSVSIYFLHLSSAICGWFPQSSPSMVRSNGTTNNHPDIYQALYHKLSVLYPR